MIQPTKCHLWEKELTREDFNLKGNFLILKTFFDDGSHSFRRLLQCNDCNQLYFYEFYEEIDWEEGEDPQLSTLIPVPNEEEAQKLAGLSHIDLLTITPRLCKDWPADRDKAVMYWVKV